MYRVRFTVDLESNFIDLNGVLWVRGKITNSGDRAIERCRVKLLRVEEKTNRGGKWFFTVARRNS
jgi:hypothetical protein